jgi:hypothetical protein
VKQANGLRNSCNTGESATLANEIRGLNMTQKTIWEQEVAGSNPVAPTSIGA